ncbi:hypothetical protein AJ78_00992 [Emergomyces pasteurianus Ep9510]|uniref:Uncharacterized protein n=1 Tax=Emergomyces pasteurianus Ep9510 TaxID=1447872 RepID=A0A1J9PRK0_9EURO|nr:hypothetical protein AJ78_00992 [Emergomyces pasteurianus Ep9510]
MILTAGQHNSQYALMGAHYSGNPFGHEKCDMTNAFSPHLRIRGHRDDDDDDDDDDGSLGDPRFPNGL